MSKLLQRLSDASKSGVYRTARSEDIVDATQGSDLRVTRIEFRGVTEKKALLDRISSALQFPDYFGRNWDALKDCLSDLAWFESRGHVLLLNGGERLPAKERDLLIEILGTVAQIWAGDGRPFFAVFVGDMKALPELYKNRK